jgi:multimeric flavodoxin WrbA
MLNGSPKGWGGSSGSFGNYLLGKIPQKGISKETHHVGKAVRKEEKWNDLVQSIKEADTIILTFPLYWDSLPSHLTKGLERLYAQKNEFENSPKFYIMVNNGFPEPWHNEIAIEICKFFAHSMNFIWQGALNIGGGAAIAGKPLEETGGMTIRLRKTLDMAAKAIGEGKPIPKEVKEQLSKPLYPSWIATTLGGFGWRKQARKKGAKTSLKSKPYER